MRERVRALDLAAALAELRALNPGGLGALDTANPRRVTRALERCLASGRTMADLAADFARQPPPFAGWVVKLVRLERPPAELAQRIEQRVAAMLALGFFPEALREQSPHLHHQTGRGAGHGYREVIAMLDGRLPAAQLAAEIVKNTRALVKKQQTWFRTQLPEHRVVPAATADAAALF